MGSIMTSREIKSLVAEYLFDLYGKNQGELEADMDPLISFGQAFNVLECFLAWEEKRGAPPKIPLDEAIKKATEQMWSLTSKKP